MQCSNVDVRFSAKCGVNFVSKRVDIVEENRFMSYVDRCVGVNPLLHWSFFNHVFPVN